LKADPVMMANTTTSFEPAVITKAITKDGHNRQRGGGG
jgi:hypothetical protein